jgi:hypothetical protein
MVGILTLHQKTNDPDTQVDTGPSSIRTSMLGVTQTVGHMCTHTFAQATTLGPHLGNLFSTRPSMYPVTEHWHGHRSMFHHSIHILTNSHRITTPLIRSTCTPSRQTH